MKFSFSFPLIATGLLLAAIPNHNHASILYWDINGNSPGAGGTQPGGIWNLDSSVWNTVSDGTGETIGWNPGSVAVFSAGMDATGAYPVLIEGTQTFGGLRFDYGAVTIRDGLLAPGANSFAQVASGITAIIESPLTGSERLTKIGPGILRLAGQSSGYTGVLTIQEGILRVEGSNAQALGNGSLELKGGELHFINDVSVNFGRPTILSADTRVFIDRFVVGAGVNMTLGPLTVNEKATLTVDRGTQFNPGSIYSQLLFGATTLAEDLELVMSPTSIVQMGAITEVGGSPRTLTLSGVSNSTSILYLNGANAHTGGTVVNSGRVYAIGANSLGALGTTTTMHAGNLELRNVNAAVGRNITYTGTGILTIALNSVAGNPDIPVNVGSLTHLGGNLTITANSTSSSNVVPRRPILTNDLALNGNLTFNPSVLTTLAFNGVISEEGGSRTLTKTGLGTLELGGEASYSGLTSLANGVIKLGVNNALPSGVGKGGLNFTPTALLTSTLDLNGFSQTLNAVTNTGLGTSVIDNTSPDPALLTFGGADSDGLFSGLIQNSGGPLSIAKVGSGIMRLTGAMFHTGSTRVDGGALSVTNGGLNGTSDILVGVEESGELNFYGSAEGGLIVLGDGVNVTLGGLESRGSLGFKLGLNAESSDRIIFSEGGELVVGAGGGFVNGLALPGFAIGNSYPIIQGAASLTGIENLHLGSLPGGFTYALAADEVAGSVTLSVLGEGAAGDLFWIGSQGPSWALLSNGGNWSTTADGLASAGFSPGSMNTVNFSASNGALGAVTTTLDNAYSIQGLQFLPSLAESISIQPGVDGSLTLGSVGIQVYSGAPALTTITSSVSLAANQTWLVADAGSLLALANSLTGSAALTKTGAGTLALADLNAFTGLLTLEAGALEVFTSSNTGLGSGSAALTLNGGSLRLISAANRSLGRNATVGGEVTLIADRIDEGAGLTYTLGTLAIGDNHFTLATGATLPVSGVTEVIFGATTLSGSPTFTVDDNGLGGVTRLRLGAITESVLGSGFTKEGNGVLRIIGVSTYSGPTFINEGIVEVAITNGTSPNSAVTIAEGAVLSIMLGSTTIGSLSGAGIVENGSLTTARALTVGADGTDTVFSGVLRNGNVPVMTLTKVGSGKLTLTGNGSTMTGTITVSGGILELRGTMNNSPSATNAGVSDGTTGTILVGAGSHQTQTITLGNGSSRAGALVITGGVIETLTPTTSSGVSVGTGGYGWLSVAGGSLTTNRISSDNTTDAAGSLGLIRITGGTVVNREYVLLRNTNWELTMTGGELMRAGASQALGLGFQYGGTGVMTLSGGLINNSGQEVTFGQSSAATTTLSLNLNGGELITNRIRQVAVGTKATLNFNGGTLTAAGPATDFINALPVNSVSYVNAAFGDHSGGAVFNTAGHNVTVGLSMLVPHGQGLTELTLAHGGSGYIGAPYVQITGGGGTGATAYAVVDEDPTSPNYGKVVDVVISNPGVGYTSLPDITLIGGAGTGAVISAAQISTNASGGLTKQGMGTLTLSGTNTYMGPTTILAGTLTAASQNAIPAASTVVVDGGVLNVGSFNIMVGGLTLLEGSVIGTTGGLVSDGPFELTSGSVGVSLSGQGGLNKIGAGTLQLLAANSFSGPVTVAEGLLEFGSAASLGDGSVTNTLLMNGGILSYVGADQTTFAPLQSLQLGLNGGTLNAALPGAEMVFIGGLMTTSAAAANLTKTGSGIVTINGPIDLNGGGFTVAKGVLNAGLTADGVGSLTLGGGATLNLLDGLTTITQLCAMTLVDGSVVGFELNGGGNSDRLVVSGAANATGNIVFNLFDLGGFGIGSYDLVSAGSGLSGGSFELGNAPAGLNLGLVVTDTLVRLVASELNFVYWTGDRSNGLWSSLSGGDTNWANAANGLTDLGALPTTTDTVVFSAQSAAGSHAIIVDGAIQVDSLKFLGSSDTALGSITLIGGEGGTLTIAPFGANNGIFVGTDSGVTTINAPLVVGSNQSWQVEGGGVNGSALVVNGDVAFLGRVKKSGAGSLTLSGDNSGAGGLMVMEGAIYLNSPTAPGSGRLTLGAGVILDNTSGGAIALANDNEQVWNGGFVFAGTNDLNLGSGEVTLTADSLINALVGDLTVGGTIGDGGNHWGLTKAGEGSLTLLSASTFSGGTRLTDGLLNINHSGALGLGRFTLSGGTIGNTSGGAITLSGDLPQTWTGNFAFVGPDDLNLGAGAVSLNGNHSITVQTGALTVGGGLSDGGLGYGITKDGPGTLVLAGANQYLGATTINDGSLILAGDHNLTTPSGPLIVGSTPGSLLLGSLSLEGSSARFGSLLVQSNSKVYNQIAISAGETLQIDGVVNLGFDSAAVTFTRLAVSGEGSFQVGTPSSPTNANFSVGLNQQTSVSNGTILDMTGLGTFYANLGSGTFRIGDIANGGGGRGTGGEGSTVRLAHDSTIIANTLALDSATIAVHTIELGSGTNTLWVNTLTVGGSSQRADGRMLFGAESGSLVVRNRDGTGRAAMTVGYGAGSTAGVTFGTADFLGHEVDLLLSTLNIGGRLSVASPGSTTGTFSMDEGVLDVQSVIVGERRNAGDARIATSTATLNLLGGQTIVSGALSIALNTATHPGTGVFGTVTIGGDAVATMQQGIILGNATSTAGVVTTATLNVTGASSLTVGGDIAKGAGAGFASVVSTLLLDGGSLDLSGFAIGSLLQPINNLNMLSGTLANVGEINGGSGLVKTGSGMLVLKGSNGYSGGTTIADGVLQVGVGGSSGTLGLGSVVNEGILRINRDDSFALSMAISGSGSFEQAGSGETTLSANNSFTGMISIFGGVLQIAAESALGSNPAVFSPSHLSLDGGTLAVTADVSLDDSNRGIALGANSGTFAIPGGFELILSNAITGAGGFRKTGLGTLVLGGVNSYEGSTNLLAGTVSIASASNLGAAPGVFSASHLTFDGGTLRTTQSMALDDSNRGITLGSAGGTLEPLVGSSLVVSSPITGSGGLVKQGGGSLTLATVSDYSGGTTLAEGALFASVAGALGSGPVTVTGGELRLTDTLLGDLTLAGTELSPAVFRLGPEILKSGIDLLELEGSLTLGDYSIIDFYLSQTGFTRLEVDTVASISPTSRFRINLAEGYIPSAGSAFPLLDWDVSSLGITDWTSYLILPELPEGSDWLASGFGSGVLSLSGTATDPAFIMNPASQLTSSGQSVTFTVAVMGSDPILIQWFKDSDPIPGAVGLSYTIDEALSTDNGGYSARASNGIDTVFSAVATLQVVEEPLILAEPSGGLIYTGQGFTFTVEAVGPGPLAFQWKKGTANIGSNSPSFAITNATVADSGDYTVQITNAFGTTISQTAVLVVEDPVIFDVSPSDVMAAEGRVATFTVGVSGAAPFTYQWTFNGVAIPDANDSVYEVIAQPESIGTYRVVVTSVTANRSATSSPATLSLDDPAVDIKVAPLSQIVAAGEDVTLSVEADGALPQFFQWRRTGKNLVGSNSASLVIPEITTAGAGLYSVIVSNSPSTGPTSQESLPARIAVVDTAPRQIVLRNNAPARLRAVAASHTTDPLSYKWFENVGTAAAPAWSEVLPLEQSRDLSRTGLPAGLHQFRCEITATGGFLNTGVYSVSVINETPEINLTGVTQLPDTKVGAAYRFQVPLVGQTIDAEGNITGGLPVAERLPSAFTARGLPRGLMIDSTGLISGRAAVAGDFTVTLIARNTSGASANVVLPLRVGIFDARLIGTFTGPIQRSAELNADLGGMINFTITRLGAQSGRLTMGTRNLAFRGTVDISDSDPDLAHVRLLVSRGGSATPLILSFSVGADSGLLSGGEVSDGVEVVALDGWRYTWIADRNNRTPAADYAGLYTQRLTLPSPPTDPLAVPGGDGFASLNVNAGNGRLKIAGRLADGIAFQTATFLGPNGEVMIFRTLYSAKARGSIVGSLTIDKGEVIDVDSGLTGSVLGSADWLRPELVNPRLYPAGFRIEDLVIEGGRYQAPPALTRILGIQAVESGGINAVLQFEGANLETDLPVMSGPLETSVGFLIDDRNRAVADVMNNPRAVRLVINPRTGVLSGRYVLEQANPIPGARPFQVKRTVPYQALIVRWKDGSGEFLSQGTGYTLVPQLPGSPTQQLSGLVTLDKFTSP